MLQYIYSSPSPISHRQKHYSEHIASTQSKEKIIEHYSYNLGSLLGEGSYSQVFKGVDSNDNSSVAIKVIDRKKLEIPYVFHMIQQEIIIMGHLKHENIVRVMEVLHTMNNIYIIQEFCEGGDLSATLSEDKLFTENEVLSILKGILPALKELKRVGIMHRDIKPANIFVKNGLYKIGDFGFARSLDFSETPLEEFLVGTPLYMSPQCLQKKEYCEKTDIWALGITLFELLTGDVPWPAESPEALLYEIYHKEIKFPENMSPDLKNLIKKCLVIEEKKRVTLEETIELFNEIENKINKNEENDSLSKAETEKDANNNDEKYSRCSSNENTERKISEDSTKIIKKKQMIHQEKKNTHSNSYDEKQLISIKSKILKKNNENDNAQQQQTVRNEMNLYENQINHVKFHIFVKDCLKTLLNSMGIKETIKPLLLLHKAIIIYLQPLMKIFREKTEKSNRFAVFSKHSKEIETLYHKSLEDYKEFVNILETRKEFIIEIMQDKGFQSIITQETILIKADIYPVLKKELQHFIRFLNHLCYKKLKNKGVFSKTQGKALYLMVEFHDYVKEIIENKSNTFQLRSTFSNLSDFEKDVSSQYYCNTLRKRIFESGI